MGALHIWRDAEVPSKTWWEEGRGLEMSELEGRKGKATLAVSMVGILLGSMMLVGIVRAADVSFQIPIPNQTGIRLTATASNGRLGGGDSLIFTISVQACSDYAQDSVVSAKVIAYSDANVQEATKYARVGLNHVIVPAYGCTTVSKTVRVHHAAEAMTDSDAYLVASATIKRDGTVKTALDTATVDVASFIRQLVA